VIGSRNWTAYDAAQSEEKRRFVVLLAELCSTVPQPEQRGKGRPRLPLSDMLFASVLRFTWASLCGGLPPTYGKPSLKGS
jgi:hypothetical protein